jgi:hypothetical protein
MPLLGKGVLAIWNGITDAGEAEFIKWHIQEHIPERVGLSGFLRGRRYIAYDGHPKYFNFYETETAETLGSPEYLARLNAPTPWTQAVVKEFRDTSRTICEVVASLGRGEGAWIETIRFWEIARPDTFPLAVAGDYMSDIAKRDGIVGVHFLRGANGQGKTATAESKLRNQPDTRCDWLLLIEAAELQYLQALRSQICSDQALQQHGAGAAIEHGIYRLQYSLTHSELGRTD